MLVDFLLTASELIDYFVSNAIKIKKNTSTNKNDVGEIVSLPFFNSLGEMKQGTLGKTYSVINLRAYYAESARWPRLTEF